MVLALWLAGALLALWLGAAVFLVLRLGIGLRQALLYSPLKLAFRIDDRAIAAAHTAEAPIIYVVWHQSRLEPALMLSLLPSDTLHILDEASAGSAWLDPWRALARTITFNATHVFVSRRLVRRLKGKGRLAVYLPDDVEPGPKSFRLYRALARIAANSDARIVPIVVRGSRNTAFSLTPPGMAPRRLLARLVVTALGPKTTAELAAGAGAGRATAANAFFDRVAEARYLASDVSGNLFDAVHRTAMHHGTGRLAVKDATGDALTYRQLLAGARVLGGRLAGTSVRGEAIGLMLPNGNAFATAFLALQSAGRVAAMINHTAGPANVAAAIGAAGVKTVLSSREFVENAELSDVVSAIEKQGAGIAWLEDLQQSASLAQRAGAALAWHRPLARPGSDDTAAILFTSGSEGTPKGVALSHRNLLANVAQVATRIAFSPRDRLFNPMPVFHSFGLTAGVLLPLVSGIRVYLYPSPLHHRLVPETAATERPTILLGTNTFLAAYAREAGEEDFADLRLVVAGAEPLRAETRRLWRERFDAAVIEGYGLTEAAPFVAVNSATHGREKTVGRLLPGIAARLEKVEGLAEGARLWLAGPNIMRGYVTPGRPGGIEPPEEGWHDTGDIVSIDREGFVTVRGRARRFAKIAGEMVSLAAVETLAEALWPDDRHAAVAVPDRRRGERIVLVTTAGKAGRDALRRLARKQGAADIAIPGDVLQVAALPVMASGKIDYAATRQLALERLGVEAAA